MEYERRIVLKDGRTCILRNGRAQDAEAALSNFLLTHHETDYLTSYPDENTTNVEQEGIFLQQKQASPDEIELLAVVNDRVVGTAGIDRIGRREKVRHRAQFGISVEKAFWGQGIGRALTEACVECAKAAGYTQLELEVVADNKAAMALYERVGFVEYGRNPKGFRSRQTGWQELVLMRLELEEENRESEV